MKDRALEADKKAPELESWHSLLLTFQQLCGIWGPVPALVHSETSESQPKPLGLHKQWQAR
jgi:hypothetical protein